MKFPPVAQMTEKQKEAELQIHASAPGYTQTQLATPMGLHVCAHEIWLYRRVVALLGEKQSPIEEDLIILRNEGPRDVRDDVSDAAIIEALRTGWSVEE